MAGKSGNFKKSKLLEPPDSSQFVRVSGNFRLKRALELAAQGEGINLPNPSESSLLRSGRQTKQAEKTSISVLSTRAF